MVNARPKTVASPARIPMRGPYSSRSSINEFMGWALLLAGNQPNQLRQEVKDLILETAAASSGDDSVSRPVGRSNHQRVLGRCSSPLRCQFGTSNLKVCG